MRLDSGKEPGPNPSKLMLEVYLHPILIPSEEVDLNGNIKVCMVRYALYSPFPQSLPPY